MNSTLGPIVPSAMFEMKLGMIIQHEILITEIMINYSALNTGQVLFDAATKEVVGRVQATFLSLFQIPNLSTL